MKNHFSNNKKTSIKKWLLFLWFFNLQIFVWGQSSGFVDSLFVKRLNSLNLGIEIPYNDVVGDNITLLTHQKARSTAQALGVFLAEKDYIDSMIKAARLPEELKYLPLALTQMNYPNQNNFHCAGTWQLSYFVAISYGLIVNDEIDERYDLQKSTLTAVAYLKNLSEKYSDFWEMLIAYANSPSALKVAKIRAYPYKDIWSLYDYGNLPRRDIISDFITYIYLANFYQSHRIKPVAPKIKEEFAAVYLQQKVLRENFVSMLQLEKSYLADYNPTLIGKYLPAHYEIFIPWEKSSLFSLIEDSLYVINNEKPDTVKKIIAVSQKQTTTSTQTKPTYYTVKSGDVLGRLAIEYNTTVALLKKWNDLKNDNIYIGQRLIVRWGAASSKTETTRATSTSTTSNTKNTPAKKDNNKKEIIYIIKSGDTLSKIAKIYRVSIDDIKKWNNLKNDNIFAGQKLIIL
jgi:membrane-bound lytic murein transglycosylase D